MKAPSIERLIMFIVLTFVIFNFTRCKEKEEEPVPKGVFGVSTYGDDGYFYKWINYSNACGCYKKWHISPSQWTITNDQECINEGLGTSPCN